jgi:ABC-type uncharacterized transport system substrate-binding protein
VLDHRGRLLRAALGFAGLPRPSYDRPLWALRTWLDSCSSIGGVAVVLTLGLILAPLAAEAQPAGKVPRVAYLTPWSDSDPGRQRGLEAFRQGLRDLGYVEGQNIAIESRSAEGKDDRLPALAADLVRSKVDVIVATSGAATKAAQQATRTIPIVMSLVNDPVGSGLVASLARPGGNVTGLTIMAPDLMAKPASRAANEVRVGDQPEDG